MTGQDWTSGFVGFVGFSFTILKGNDIGVIFLGVGISCLITLTGKGAVVVDMSAGAVIVDGCAFRLVGWGSLGLDDNCSLTGILGVCVGSCSFRGFNKETQVGYDGKLLARIGVGANFFSKSCSVTTCRNRKKLIHYIKHNDKHDQWPATHRIMVIV